MRPVVQIGRELFSFVLCNLPYRGLITLATQSMLSGGKWQYSKPWFSVDSKSVGYPLTPLLPYPSLVFFIRGFINHPAFVNMTLRACSRTARFSLQTALTIFSPYLFIFTIKSVAIAQSLKKSKRPRVVTTLGTKLKIIRNVEADLS
jgi:hypothetical protein